MIWNFLVAGLAVLGAAWIVRVNVADARWRARLSPDERRPADEEDRREMQLW